MTHLKTINFSGFKSIRSMETMELGPINLLVGDTSAGKTNLLLGVQSIWSLYQGYFAGMVDQSGDPHWLLHRDGDEHMRKAELTFEFEEPYARYELQLARNGDQPARPRRVRVRVGWGDAEPALIWWTTPVNMLPHQNVLPQKVVDFISRIAVHRGYDAPAMGTVYGYGMERNTAPAIPGPNGVSEFLHWLSRHHGDHFDRIGKVMAEIDPTIETIDFVAHPANNDLSMLAFVDRHTGHRRLCNEESRALRRSLSAVTAMLQPDDMRPSLFLMDEPCLGLSPRGQHAMGRLVRELSHQTQFIIATQAPAFFSEFRPDDGIRVERQDGASSFTRMTEEQVKEVA